MFSSQSPNFFDLRSVLNNDLSCPKPYQENYSERALTILEYILWNAIPSNTRSISNLKNLNVQLCSTYIVSKHHLL